MGGFFSKNPRNCSMNIAGGSPFPSHSVNCSGNQSNARQNGWAAVLYKNDLNPALILFLRISLKSLLAPSWRLSGAVALERRGPWAHSRLPGAQSSERQTWHIPGSAAVPDQARHGCVSAARAWMWRVGAWGQGPCCQLRGSCVNVHLHPVPRVLEDGGI